MLHTLIATPGDPWPVPPEGRGMTNVRNITAPGDGDDGHPGTPWTPPQEPPSPDGDTPPGDGTHRK
ncbi:hypothetical protein [Streptomyces sp. NPDC088348]|uniref:hypothetical protein n=1 Tax=Streptomyces sp. NPDC088348 TaxID=3365853 RepID=UPI0037F7E1C5